MVSSILIHKNRPVCLMYPVYHPLIKPKNSHLNTRPQFLLKRKTKTKQNHKLLYLVALHMLYLPILNHLTVLEEIYLKILCQLPKIFLPIHLILALLTNHQLLVFLGTLQVPMPLDHFKNKHLQMRELPNQYKLLNYQKKTKF